MYPDGRGSFCRDCGNCYRICHKSSMTASLFDRWLMCEDNRRLWTKQLLSYMSLKVEGTSHVTPAALLARQKTLEWLFHLMQIPFPNFQVVQPSDEFWRKLADGGVGRYLVKSSGGGILGLEPAPQQMAPHRSSSRFVTQAQAQVGWPFAPWSVLPPSAAVAWGESVADRAYRGAVPEGLEMQPELDAIAEVERGQSGVSKQRLVFGGKVDALTMSARVIIGSFIASDGSTKEREFNPLIQKIVKLKMDLLDSAMPDLVTAVGSLASIVQAAKKIAGPWSTYMRINKRSLLDNIRDPMEIIYKYATKEGMPCGPAFCATYIKGKFFTAHESSAHAAMEALRSFDFSWASESTDFDLQPATVIHQCMMMQILDGLRKPVPDDDADWVIAKQGMLADSQAYLATLEALLPKFPALAGSHEVIKAFVVILSAAANERGVVPTDVVHARQLVEDTELAVQLREGLGFSGIGMAIKGDSDSVVLKGELDDQLDSEYDLLLRALFTEGMPQAVGDKLSVLDDMCSIQDGGKCSMMDIAQQSLEQIIGVLRGWSPKRVSEELDSMLEIFAHIVDIVMAFDDRRSLDCSSTWSSYLAAWAEDFEGADLTSWPPMTTHSVMPPVTQPDESCIAPLAATIDNLESVIGESFSFAPQVLKKFPELKEAVARARKNKQRRDIAWREFAWIVKALGAEAAPKEKMMEEMMDLTNRDNSLMACLLGMAEARSQAQALPETERDGHRTIKFVREGAADMEFDMKFWDDFAKGKVVTPLLANTLFPIADEIGAFFLEKCVGVKSASLGIPADNWDVAASCAQVLLGLAHRHPQP